MKKLRQILQEDLKLIKRLVFTMILIFLSLLLKAQKNKLGYEYFISNLVNYYNIDTICKLNDSIENLAEFPFEKIFNQKVGYEINLYDDGYLVFVLNPNAYNKINTDSGYIYIRKNMPKLLCLFYNKKTNFSMVFDNSTILWNRLPDKISNKDLLLETPVVLIHIYNSKFEKIGAIQINKKRIDGTLLFPTVYVYDDKKNAAFRLKKQRIYAEMFLNSNIQEIVNINNKIEKLFFRKYNRYKRQQRIK